MKVRTFETGATRDTDEGKLDYEGFFSPLVLKRRAEYMHENRVQSDGSLRASDNWQKGIPIKQYMKSLFRHFMEVWIAHRKGGDIEQALCALMFNAEGYLHETLKASVCISCGGKIADVLQRAGSTRCHDCRDTDDPFNRGGTMMVKKDPVPETLVPWVM